MNRNNFWRFIIVILVVAWSLFETYPPTNRDLIEVFSEKAERRDEAFNKIVADARERAKARPDHEYAALLEAIGTNDLIHIFPSYKDVAEKEAHPTEYILNRIQRDAAGKVKLGIDLQGGMSFLVEMDTNSLASATNQNSAAAAYATRAALNQAVEVLRKRVDKFGVAEPVIQPEGDNRITIQLPGLSEEAQEEAKTTIQRVAFLEFRLVHPQSDELVEEGSTIVAGYELRRSPHKSARTGRDLPGYLVKKHAELTGGIKTAWFNRDELGRPEVEFVFESGPAEVFGNVTTHNVGQQLAIVLDGDIITAPHIQNPITSGRGVITGSYTDKEAQNLANVLENPLKTPIHIISQNSVDPTLGNDTIHSGIKACIIGVIAVAAFMVIYYLLAGAIANVALVCNIIILLGVMCSIQTTLTLPGIAGIVLTVGMAVDANVLIFERIREESAKGKSLRGALNAGYDRAFGTIFDSHVTTLISSIILIFMGTGSVKGFGVSLTIGVAASLFTALVVTRLIFDWLLAKNILKSLWMQHLIPATLKINFMRLALPAFIASWLLILVGNAYGIFVRGHEVFGVEFVGGEQIKLAVDQQHKPSVDKIREVAGRTSGSEVLVSYQRDVSRGIDTLLVTAREAAGQEIGKGAADNKEKENVGDKIFTALKAAFPEAGFGDKPLETIHVGGSVGQEIQQTAIVASLLAMFGILVYVAFRYEFSFAVGAVVAILHDILMTLGCYFLAGRELNATTVAAVLTIIGFSINDTIVIFDRIREDLKLGVRGSFRDLMNQALNQTLSRTIITSGTVFLATLSLYIFGGGPINDFAFTFLVGILTGTYSSIYIASALVLWWHKGQRPKIGSAQLAVENASAARG